MPLRLLVTGPAGEAPVPPADHQDASETRPSPLRHRGGV